MSELLKQYKCTLCNNLFKSYQSRSNHIKRYHQPNKVNNQPENADIKDSNNKEKSYQCSFCNKNYKHSQSRWRHEQKCESRLKQTKIDNSTNNTNINSHNTTNNTINNTINNNFYVNGLGFENISLLSYDNINEIYKSNRNCLIKFIELLNFNDALPENHTFCNTSLEGKYVSYIDNKNNKISKMNKLDCYDLVLSNSLKNINIILDSIKNKMNQKEYQKFVNLIDDTKNMYLGNKDSKNIYTTQLNEISYNNKELILESWKNAHIKEIEDENSLSEVSERTDSSDEEGNLKFNVKRTSDFIKINKNLEI